MLTKQLLVRCLVECFIAHITRSDKRKKGEPKETIDITKELRDCLRVRHTITYGNGGSIVANFVKGTRMYSDKADQERSGTRPIMLPKKFIKLVSICKRRTSGFKASDIYSLMFNMEMYETAYKKLKSNPGNPGINQVTLDGKEVFQGIISEMKDESFQFKPIPKPDGKTRPLTVARDKIVQEVIRMILEAIFESTFSDNSHGFRMDRSCHTALRQVRTQFGGASFFIEGDISKCFDSFDHQLLIKLLEERINDDRFIKLI